MKIIMVLSILILLPLVSAARLGASNSKLDYNISINEEICKRISIGTDYLGKVVADLKFANEALKISDYNKNPNYFKINAKYEKEIDFKKIENKETLICISGKNPGKYYGLITYKLKGSNAGIGIKININILNKKENLEKIRILIFNPILYIFLLIFLTVIKKKIS